MNTKRSTRRRIKHVKSTIVEPQPEVPEQNPETEAQNRLIEISEIEDKQEYVLSFRPLYQLSQKSQTPKQQPQHPASYNPSPRKNIITQRSEPRTTRHQLERTVMSIIKGQSVFVRQINSGTEQSRLLLPPVRDRLLRRTERPSKTLENDRALRRAVVIVNESDFLRPTKRLVKKPTGKLVLPLRSRQLTLGHNTKPLKLDLDFFQNHHLRSRG